MSITRSMGISSHIAIQIIWVQRQAFDLTGSLFKDAELQPRFLGTHCQ